MRKYLSTTGTAFSGGTLRLKTTLARIKGWKRKKKKKKVSTNR